MNRNYRISVQGEKTNNNPWSGTFSLQYKVKKGLFSHKVLEASGKWEVSPIDSQIFLHNQAILLPPHILSALKKEIEKLMGKIKGSQNYGTKTFRQKLEVEHFGPE